MKRLLLLAVGLAIGAATAQAQGFVAMYSEVYHEATGVLESRQWNDARGNTRLETPNGDVTITLIDSMVSYFLRPAEKTAMAVRIMDIADPNKMIGRVVQTGQTEKREVVRQGVDVEGYLCDQIAVTIKTTNADGTTGGTVENMWWNAELNTWIRYGTGSLNWDIRRNIQPGPQPAHLFEIPRDYTVSRLPSGGLMQMMTGQQQTEQQKQQTMSQEDMLKMMLGGEAGAAMQGVVNQQAADNKKIDETKNDASRSTEQKAADILNILGGALGGGKK